MNLDLSQLPRAIAPKFYPLLHDRSRYLVMMGGAASTKSETAAAKILIRCMTETGHRYLCVRKVAERLRESCHRQLRMVIDRHGWGQAFRIRYGPLGIECVNGSEILFAGLDDPDKLKSIAQITGLWQEEATEESEQEHDNLQLRLRGAAIPGYKQTILSFNPVLGGQWIKRRFFDSPQPAGETTTHHSTYRDNPWLSKTDLRDFERLETQNPTLWKVYGMGEWGTLVGIVYDRWKVVQEGDWPAAFGDESFGLDFGYNHPCALVHCGFQDGQPWFREVLYGSGWTVSDLLGRMDALGIDRGASIYGDSSRPEMIEEIRRAGYNCRPSKKGAGSVLAGIQFLCGLECHVSAGSANIIRELGRYAWEINREEKPTEKPVKMWDDCMDACRYAVTSHIARLGGAVYSVPRSSIGY